MAETANDLVLKCTTMARAGADFPTVWDTVLKGHALVAGQPIQGFDDEERPQLEIQLIKSTPRLQLSVQAILRFVGSTPPPILAHLPAHLPRPDVSGGRNIG
jgi:hypothetical protein